jgi:hypothetical protein
LWRKNIEKKLNSELSKCISPINKKIKKFIPDPHILEKLNQ